MNVLESLAQMVESAPRTGAAIIWKQVFADLDTVRLPVDYIQWIDAFGGGYFDEYIYLLDPSAAQSYYNLVHAHREQIKTLEYVWSAGEERPEEVLSSGVRLIPWASTDNGEFLYWVSDPKIDPDDWTIVMNEARGDEWLRFRVGAITFLEGALSGSITSDMFWPDFPLVKHRFILLSQLGDR